MKIKRDWYKKNKYCEGEITLVTHNVMEKVMMDNTIKILDRGTWKHTWHLNKSNGHIDWFNRSNLEKAKREIENAENEAKDLLVTAQRAKEEIEEQEKLMVDEPVKVWAWQDAPAEYRDMSPHGGDEDWVALVPPGLDPAWIDHIGVCDVSEHHLEGGWRVYIGSHA